MFEKYLDSFPEKDDDCLSLIAYIAASPVEGGHLIAYYKGIRLLGYGIKAAMRETLKIMVSAKERALGLAPVA